MVLINGRKFACDGCIRGHRASSCSHTARQLLPVRPKGRPTSQCNTCKAKRASSSFHGRCRCNATSMSPVEENVAADDTMKGKFAGALLEVEGSRGRHSLDALMNPCRCKTTGICTCCKTDTVKEDGQAQEEAGSNGACCDVDECCAESNPGSSCSPSFQGQSNGGCCSNKKAQVQPIHPLPSAEPVQEFNDMYGALTPPCHCGLDCSCPGCLRTSGTSSQFTTDAKENEECPEKCITCSACVFGLTRPSGIQAVDEWMERDMQSTNQVEQRRDEEEGPSKKAKLSAEHSAQAIAPPLPPFASASTFFSSHFLDLERRQYFAQQLQAGSSAQQLSSPSQLYTDNQKEVAYGERRPGESDEDWQIRHGFYYLTPESIRIFDSTRKFKEERQQLEDQEELLTDSQSPASSVTPVMNPELDELRRKALSARKKPNQMPV